MQFRSANTNFPAVQSCDLLLSFFRVLSFASFLGKPKIVARILALAVLISSSY